MDAIFQPGRLRTRSRSFNLMSVFPLFLKVVGVRSVLSSAKKINSILLILPCTVEFSRRTVKSLSHGSVGS